MYSGISALTTDWQTRGVATVTSPAPDRSAPSAARRAAPVLPVDPPHDQHTTAVALVDVVRSGHNPIPCPLTSQHLDTRTLEGLDHRLRNPDVGDHHVAGLRRAW